LETRFLVDDDLVASPAQGDCRGKPAMLALTRMMLRKIMKDEAELLPEMNSSRVEKGGCVSCEKMVLFLWKEECPVRTAAHVLYHYSTRQVEVNCLRAGCLT